MQVASPLLLKTVIDNGIIPHDKAVVVWVAVAVAGLAIGEALLTFTETWLFGKIGEGLVYDLRTQVFDHVQRQPIAFFTRTQTGSLVSRLNTDVIAAQQAVTALLSQTVSSLLSLIVVLVTMFILSWQITLIALAAVPLFLLPGRVVGRRLQGIMREGMQMNAEMGSLLHERFNVEGALLAKLYGRPADETRQFTVRAARVSDIGVVTQVYSRMLLVSVTFIGSLATAVVYGLGGILVVDGSFQLGTLVALTVLLTRLFGPVNQLSSMQASVMTALVSFDRLFEVLNLKPLIAERPGAVALKAAAEAPEVEFDKVSFRYPKASEVSLPSLEGFAVAAPERPDRALILEEISFSVPTGTMTALVGPSGAGKTTITHLVPRLYDPLSGAVRIGGRDVRDLTLDCLRQTVGMVTQDAHLYHETLRANLEYARPGASEAELIEACEAARIWELISSLPDGLDTVVGDRGYRFSGGEKQRLSIARLLLKEPSIVVLDEATAHLDSESEAAIQQALRTALQGRTSLVIAHRLSTIRDADQILVVDAGRVVERGKHEELLAAGGLYAELHRTQFARRPVGAPDAATGPIFGDPNGNGLPPLVGMPPDGVMFPPSGPPPMQGPPPRRPV